jgi:peroxiredoxin
MLTSNTVRSALAALAFSGLALAATAASAAPEVGKPAPDFSATGIDGKPVKLSDLWGKTVVLEWTNDECPYVAKHYGSGNMQALQRDATKDGVVWISLISSAKGEQGWVDPKGAEDLTKSRNAAPSTMVLDESGKIGRAYEARTTPHMFVIAPDGKLAYMGGIDDKPTTRTSDVASAKNYVRAALDAVKAGQPVTTPVARPYGCSIKYAPENS